MHVITSFDSTTKGWVVHEMIWIKSHLNRYLVNKRLRVYTCSSLTNNHKCELKTFLYRFAMHLVRKISKSNITRFLQVENKQIEWCVLYYCHVIFHSQFFPTDTLGYWHNFMVSTPPAQNNYIGCGGQGITWCPGDGRLKLNIRKVMKHKVQYVNIAEGFYATLIHEWMKPDK